MVRIDRLLFVHVLFAVLCWHCRCFWYIFSSRFRFSPCIVVIFLFSHSAKHFHRWDSMKLSRLIMFDFALFSTFLCIVSSENFNSVIDRSQCCQTPRSFRIAYQWQINWFHLFYSHVKNNILISHWLGDFITLQMKYNSYA